MMLCVDAGNSRLKWGLRDRSAWLDRGVVAYDDAPDWLGHLPPGASQLVACNVAGAAIGERIESFARQRGLNLFWLTSSAEAGGVRNSYRRPQQLGADRWAALIGARRHSVETALVVVAGTATTIDVLDSDGRFRGGLILPGLAMMRRALARMTAGLPEATGELRDFPDNTDDAIASGTIQATLGAIEQQATIAGPAICLVSGGAAPLLAPHLKRPNRVIDTLVLDGLAGVGDELRKVA